MDTTPQRPKGRNGPPSTLSAAIEALNRAKEAARVTQANAIFCSVSILLIMIRDSKAKRTDCVELGLACADVCKALDRGMNGRQANEFNRSVFEAIEQLTATVAEIQRDISKISKRGAISRLVHANNDRDTIAAWRSKLRKILHVFNTELAIKPKVAVSSSKNITSKTQRTPVEGGKPLTRKSLPGESPPPPPTACFGRAELVKKIVDLAEGLTSMALIGPGGIGKTSVARAVLHDGRIQKRFGDNRRFIRCDQFPASCAHFLARLSKAIGAGIENPEDLTSLRPSLSSNEMFIVLDNAESILDPQGASGQEIYRLVEELSGFPNICLAITSRITTLPPNCKALEVETLSTSAAHDTFYNIYEYGKQSELVSNILKQLDSHPLSVTLLATVAHQNGWDNGRLVKEWEEHHTGLLQTGQKTSLATTIELSLTSPMFQELGPDARGLLGVIAFYPQGINENNIKWLLPTIPNKTHILDKFCVLSLTYRSNGFITMLAPLRDHLCPKDPESSTHLCTTKERYFARLSDPVAPSHPGFKNTQWISSEDVNVEHLLDDLTTSDPDSEDVWDACIGFIKHIHWNKPRRTVLSKKIEALPDSHDFKPLALQWLALLFGMIGNHTEKTRLLNNLLKLGRDRGDGHVVGEALKNLCVSNRLLGHYKDGIGHAREALDLYERLGRTLERAKCFGVLGNLLQEDGQLDAAEEAVLESMKLLPGSGQEGHVRTNHQALGAIYHSKGEREKAIYHYEVALRMASTINQPHFLFWIYLALADVFLDEDEFDKAQVHLEQAKACTFNNPYNIGRVVHLQAKIWYGRRRFDDAASEARRAQEIFKQLGSLKDLENCKILLQKIEGAT